MQRRRPSRLAVRGEGVTYHIVTTNADLSKTTWDGRQAWSNGPPESIPTPFRSISYRKL